MAFTAFTAAETDPAKPNKSELWKKTKDNFDDHESRIVVTEAAVGNFRPLVFDVFGEPSGATTEVLLERINFDITINSAKLFVIRQGSSGTLTVDVQKSTNNGGSWTTIYSTKPTSVVADGDYFLTTAEVLSTTTADTGDLLRLNIDAAQVDQDYFQVIIEFEQA